LSTVFCDCDQVLNVIKQILTNSAKLSNNFLEYFCVLDNCFKPSINCKDEMLLS